MKRFECEVVGSSGDIYNVAVEWGPGVLRMFCTCQAGQNGQYCKHRFALLEGDFSHIVGGDRDEVASIPDLLKGTELERVFKTREEAEAAVQAAKKKLQGVNKQVARVMHGE